MVNVLPEDPNSVPPFWIVTTATAPVPPRRAPAATVTAPDAAV